MQALFHPALSNDQLLNQIIFSFDDATREDKERHYSTLKGYLWETITGLGEHVAFHRLSANDESQDNDDADVVPALPLPKKPRHDDLTLALLQTLISPSAVSVHRAEAALTSSDIAKMKLSTT